MNPENSSQRIGILCTGIILAVTGAFAQTGGQKIDKFVVSGEAAAKIATKTEISGDTAAKITQVCLDFAAQRNIAVSVFVLNPSGNIVHAHRMDGQTPIAVETGLLKARTALYMRDSTHALANRVNNNLANQMRFQDLNLFPVSGGLPIIIDGQMIGAIGVGGSNQDEECAYAGLVAVLGPQPPLLPKQAPATQQIAPTRP